MDVVSSQLQSLFRHLSRVIEDGTPSQDSIEALLIMSDRLRHSVSLLVGRVAALEEALPFVESVVHSLETILSVIGTQRSLSGLSIASFNSETRGRPTVLISQDVLEYLIGNRFTVRQISQTLNVSPSTIRRHMQRYEISVRSHYSTITDSQLDALVTTIQQQHPNSGYRLTRGHLAALGYRVQEMRIRDSLRRIDPVGVVSRLIHTVNRRTYSVPSPNALWHVDGNHKLIRYVIILITVFILLGLQ